jgi:hypothetical protein
VSDPSLFSPGWAYPQGGSTMSGAPFSLSASSLPFTFGQRERDQSPRLHRGKTWYSRVLLHQVIATNVGPSILLSQSLSAECGSSHEARFVPSLTAACIGICILNLQQTQARGRNCLPRATSYKTWDGCNQISASTLL